MINALTPSGIAPAPLEKREADPVFGLAQELEATFLAEMLKSAGLSSSSAAFGGGAGEDQFTSFLVNAQARQIVRAGGIGLAENLYHALKETHDGL